MPTTHKIADTLKDVAAMPKAHAIADTLIDTHGQTFADQAGITMRDKPAPLFQLLVLSTLLSAPIQADIAVSAAHELFAAGYRTPAKLAASRKRDRIRALGRAHYRRYDDRMSTMLKDSADMVQKEWNGDLRNLHDAGEDAEGISARLQEQPGIGPTGAAIFCREVQGVWPDLAPFMDDRVAKGAKRLGLPTSTPLLAALAPEDELPELASGCVRASLSKQVVEDVRAQAL